jgi:hypothetical protein
MIPRIRADLAAEHQYDQPCKVRIRGMRTTAPTRRKRRLLAGAAASQMVSDGGRMKG